MIKILLYCGLAVVMALALGCSGEPSQDDIRVALEKSVEESNRNVQAMGGNILGKSLNTEIHAVKKLGCAESKSASGYVCDVEVDMSFPVIGRKKSVQQFRVLKTDEGWIIVE